ncbi:hypothetical protein Ddc_14559 [Ditylenchus destructor]|nr:hypothetical protein Ddc_14559 [Ditylenchus destructor]
MTENTKKVISYFAIVGAVQQRPASQIASSSRNAPSHYELKFEALVDCCKRHFLDATTPLTYNVSFVFFCNANYESKVFKMENTNTLEQLELTSVEKNNNKYLCLRRMPL